MIPTNNDDTPYGTDGKGLERIKGLFSSVAERLGKLVNGSVVRLPRPRSTNPPHPRAYFLKSRPASRSHRAGRQSSGCRGGGKKGGTGKDGRGELGVVLRPSFDRTWLTTHDLKASRRQLSANTLPFREGDMTQNIE